MRILPFLFFLFSQVALAQLNTGTGTVDCTEADLIAAGTNTIECKSLTITGAYSTSDVFDPFTPLIVRVVETVTISGSINFQGLSGALGSSAGPGGGAGGPGEFGGAGVGAGSAGTNGDCSPAGLNDAEGGGGGGGSFVLTGGNGDPGSITDNGGIAGPAGAAGATQILDLTNFTFAGSGGGGGGTGCDDDSGIGNQPGAGGGGGGGLHIIAGGNVVITGTINASGGDGQDAEVPGVSLGIGGGGGGGAGGAIVIQTLGQMTLAGALLNAVGGVGGNSLNNADGGAGGNGNIILQDLDGVIVCAGCNPAAATAATGALPVNSAESLKSSIACGGIKNTEREMIPGLVFGFAMVWLVAMVARRLRNRWPHQHGI